MSRSLLDRGVIHYSKKGYNNNNSPKAGYPYLMLTELIPTPMIRLTDQGVPLLSQDTGEKHHR